VGGSFSAGAGAESISVGGQFLARDRALMIELLADALMRPHFDAAEFGSYRDREIEFIKSAKDSDPSQLIGIYGRAALFGQHPFGRSQGGSERSLASLTQSDVVSYHAANFGADRATLVFAGDLDPKWMRQALTTAFGGWAKAKAALPVVRPASRVAGTRVLLVDSPGSSQTYFWLGNVGVDRRYRSHRRRWHALGDKKAELPGTTRRQQHRGCPPDPVPGTGDQRDTTCEGSVFGFRHFPLPFSILTLRHRPELSYRHSAGRARPVQHWHPPAPARRARDASAGAPARPM